jgi:hypothetical protein
VSPLLEREAELAALDAARASASKGRVGGDGLSTSYRVEASRYDHFQIPRRYGWRVLADASADVPEAYMEPTSTRETELELERQAEGWSGTEEEPREDLASLDEDESWFEGDDGGTQDGRRWASPIARN